MIYFGSEVQEALTYFKNKWAGNTQQILELSKEEKLLNNIVIPAFLKLIKHYVDGYKLNQIPNIEDVKQDCLSHLIEAIQMYDLRDKPFSYYNTCARNFLWSAINREKKYVRIFDKTEEHKKNNIQTLTLIEVEFLKNSVLVDNSYLTKMDEEFVDFLLFRLQNKKDRNRLLKYIIQILESRNNIDLSKKRHLYIMLRALSNLNTRDITKYRAQLKDSYASIKDLYYC